MPEKYPAEEWQEEIIGRFYDKNFFLSPVAKENPSAVQTPADKIQRSIFNFVRLIYSTVRQTVTPKITIISITNNFSGLIFRQNNVFFILFLFFVQLSLGSSQVFWMPHSENICPQSFIQLA